MITTGYSLPFRFIHSDLGAMAGRAVIVRVLTVQPDADERVAGALRQFAQLAAIGAFGSDQLAPWLTALQVKPRPVSRDQEYIFDLPVCRIASEAWVVLCHLLLRVHHDLPLRSVEVVLDGDPLPQQMRESPYLDSTYPQRYALPPFQLDDREPESGGASFYIQLHSPLTPQNEATLNGWLEAWCQGVLHGAYAIAPIDPVKDYVEPDGNGVDTYDTTIEWAIFKLKADPVGAMDGLVNLFCRFHHDCQPLASLEIG